MSAGTGKVIRAIVQWFYQNELEGLVKVQALTFICCVAADSLSFSTEGQMKESAVLFCSVPFCLFRSVLFCSIPFWLLWQDTHQPLWLNLNLVNMVASKAGSDSCSFVDRWLSKVMTQASCHVHQSSDAHDKFQLLVKSMLQTTHLVPPLHNYLFLQTIPPPKNGDMNTFARHGVGLLLPQNREWLQSFKKMNLNLRY